MKTIYSTPEYKFLDNVIKKTISLEYEPTIIFYPGVYGLIALVAASKYRGNCITSSIGNKVYRIGASLELSEIRDKFIDIYNFLYGVQTGASYATVRSMLLYIRQNPVFKYGIEFFKMLFERAATTSFGQSSDDVYFMQLGKNLLYENANAPFAFHAIDRHNYSFEKLMICNDLAIAS